MGRLRGVDSAAWRRDIMDHENDKENGRTRRSEEENEERKQEQEEEEESGNNHHKDHNMKEMYVKITWKEYKMTMKAENTKTKLAWHDLGHPPVLRCLATQ